MQINEILKLSLIILMAAIAAVFFGYLVALSPTLFPWVILALIITMLITFQNPFFGLVILILSMLLSPEITVSRVSSRAVTIRADDIMVIGIFLAWLANQALIKENKQLSKTPLDIPILIYSAIILISTFLGVIRGDVVLGRGIFYVLKYLEYFIIFFLASNIISDIKEVKISLWVGLITAVIVTLWGYFLILKGVGRTYAPFDTPSGMAGIGEPATLGGYYLIIFAVVMGIFTFSSRTNTKLFLLGILLFMLPVFIKTLSRASYLAIVPLYLTIILFSTRNKIWWIIIAAGIVISSPYLIPQIRQEMENRIYQTFQGGLDQDGIKIGRQKVKIDLSATARVWAWKYVLREKLTKKFLFGWGVTGTRFVDAQIPLILGETGCLGLLAFFWIIARILKNSKKATALETGSMSRGLGLGLIAATIALLVQSITTNTFIIVRIMEPFWFMTAIVLKLPQLQNRSKEETERVAT
jgi:hypothetical protein